MNRFLRNLSVISLMVLIIYAGISVFVFAVLPPAYLNNYQRGYVYQYRALEKADKSTPKILVVGESYMTYGIDSDRMHETTGMPVYTLGIHGGMGMCYVLEHARKFINEGDVVVFSFPNEGFKNDDHGMPLIYLSVDGEKDMFMDLVKEHPWKVLTTIGKADYKKLYQLFHDSILGYVDDGSVYNAYAFDSETGNLVYDRGECVWSDEEMYTYGQFSFDDMPEDTFKVTNDFVKYCKEKKATLSLVYCPIFEGAVGLTSDELDEYELKVSESINAPFIAGMKDSLLPYEDMYNGTRHPNSQGAIAYSDMIVMRLLEKGLISMVKAE